jgi:hypothetical protein
MTEETKSSIVLLGLTLVFLGLRAAFQLDLWGRADPLADIPPVDPQFTNITTVRLSAAERIQAEGEVIEFDCYLCHEEGKPPELKFDALGKLLVPEEHEDLDIGHGSNNRNNNCYNCHDSRDLTRLTTRDGRVLKFEESTQLCAGCHGPTFRDWEAGIHGRTVGYWARSLGPAIRADCTSCHDPHRPTFPDLNPAPGPHALHGEQTRRDPEAQTH